MKTIKGKTKREKRRVKREGQKTSYEVKIYDYDIEYNDTDKKRNIELKSEFINILFGSKTKRKKIIKKKIVSNDGYCSMLITFEMTRKEYENLKKEEHDIQDISFDGSFTIDGKINNNWLFK